MDIYRQNGNYSDNHLQIARKRQKTIESALSKQFDIKQRLPWVAQTQNPLPADLLKDYISYAREYCKPKLTQEAAAVLKNYFMTLRYVFFGNMKKGCGKSNNLLPTLPSSIIQIVTIVKISRKWSFPK